MIIPYYLPLTLSDFGISAALYYRTLAPSPLSVCSWCDKDNKLGHDELCLARPRRTVVRHDSVVNAIGGGLRTLPFATVECEPHTFEDDAEMPFGYRGRRRPESATSITMSRSTPSLANPADR